MVGKPQVERKKITDLVPDPSNANAGTERGLSMLDDSLSLVGLGRSIVTDKHGTIIGGNKTTERALDRGFEDAIVVHTTGRELVVVQRDDLDLADSDPNNAARQLAYYDNRVASVDLQWNAEQLLADVNAGFDFDHLFTDGELDLLLRTLPTDGEWGEAWDGLATGDKAPFQQMTFTLHDEQAEQVKAAIDAAKDMGAFVDSPNENSNGNALARICDLFLTWAAEHGQR